MKRITYWRRGSTGRWMRYAAELPDDGARRFLRDIRGNPAFRRVKARCC